MTPLATSSIQVCGGITTNMPNRMTGCSRRTRFQANRAAPSFSIRKRLATPEMVNSITMRHAPSADIGHSSQGTRRGLLRL